MAETRRQFEHFRRKAAGPFDQFKALIATTEVPLLGPQRRAGTVEESEVNRRLTDYFAAAKVPAHVQPLLRSAALLWHDHLDASHMVSQGIEMPDGSWLHGIMHRREPDYGNAKYWLRRVGRHAAFPELARRAEALLGDDELGLIENGEWMPFAFVDGCEQAAGKNASPLASVLMRVQAAEWDVLVEHILARCGPR